MVAARQRAGPIGIHEHMRIARQHAQRFGFARFAEIEEGRALAAARIEIEQIDGG